MRLRINDMISQKDIHCMQDSVLWGIFVLSNLGIYKIFCGVARIQSFVSYFKISREIQLCANKYRYFRLCFCVGRKSCCVQCGSMLQWCCFLHLTIYIRTVIHVSDMAHGPHIINKMQCVSFNSYTTWWYSHVVFFQCVNSSKTSFEDGIRTKTAGWSRSLFCLFGFFFYNLIEASRKDNINI